MAETAYVRNVREMWQEFNRIELDGDYRMAAREAIRQVLEGRMTNYIDRHLEEIRRTDARGGDRRNGSYERHLLTEMGDVGLRIPRTRQVSGVGVMERYRRRSVQIDQMILRCFLLGISTRKVARALLPVLGEEVSAGTVSRLAKQLDGVVASYHRRAVEDKYRILLLDGVVLKRRTGLGAKKQVVLVVLGILPSGRKEVIDFMLAAGESQAAWEGFLNQLYTRGLHGEHLQLIVKDGGQGLEAALPLVYPHVAVQRCWAHKVRNIVDKVKRVDQAAVKSDLIPIYQAGTRREAVAAAKVFIRKWQRLYPRAVKCLREGWEELLSFLLLPADWHKRTRTTNAIERRFREVRRRTRPMGVFSDRASIERILFAVFSEGNHSQQVSPIFKLTQNS